MVMLGDEADEDVLAQQMELVGEIRLLRETLHGIRGMAKIEADHGSKAWAGVVTQIDKVLNEKAHQ